MRALALTEEEKKAIEQYTTIHHTQINSFLDFDMDLNYQFQQNGWEVSFTKERLEEKMEEMINLYAAIYKSSYGKQTEKICYRGTTLNEIKKLQEGSTYDRFLSTSSDAYISKRFAIVDLGNGVYMKLELSPGTPYMEIMPSEHKGNEKEILIAPFAKIDRVTALSKENGVAKYDIKLSKPEYTLLSKEAEQNVEQEVITQADQVSEWIQENHTLKGKLESLYRQRERALQESSRDPRMQEDVRLMTQDIHQYQEERNQIQEKANAWKQHFHQLIQSKMKSKALEIDRNVEMEQEIKEGKLPPVEVHTDVQDLNSYIDNKKREQEIVSTELLGKKQEQLESLVNITIDGTDKATETVSKFHGQQIRNMAIASHMGVTQGSMENVQPLQQDIAQIKKQLEEIQQWVNEMEVEEKVERKEFDTLKKQLDEGHLFVSQCYSVLQDTIISVDSRSQEEMQQLKDRIGEKVQTVVTGKRVTKLQQERNKVVSQKDSLLSKLSSRKSIKESKLENLDLKITWQREQKNRESQTSITHLVGELELFERESSSQDAQEVTELKHKILSDFKINQTEKIVWMQQRLGEVASYEIENKTEMLQKLEAQNQLLQTRIQESRKQKQLGTQLSSMTHSYSSITELERKYDKILQKEEPVTEKTPKLRSFGQEEPEVI